MKDHPSLVTVIAPARLHMGFFDLSGSLGRHFGSIGVALNEIQTRLAIKFAPQCVVTGPAAQRARWCLRHLCTQLSVPDRVEITIAAAIPEHVGLGSGTQMALAIGAALNELYGLQLSVREIAQLTERGARSGIGIGVFEQGGLVVDGGRGENTLTPPVISHLDVPADWRFILVFDRRGQGLHGDQERQAFSELPRFPQQEAARLCYLLMMQGLPAVAEQDINQFGEVITQIQLAVGDHFALAQGGLFASPEVGEVMDWLKRQGAVAIGQTSWGPTGFCAVQDTARARNLIASLQRTFAHLKNLNFVAASARNSGGEVIAG